MARETWRRRREVAIASRRPAEEARSREGLFPDSVPDPQGRTMTRQLRGRIKARQRGSVSRVLSPERVTQGDGHFSRTPVARHLERPYPRARTGRPIALLFGLAPGGVCLADAVTRAAGELLPHRFTLTAPPPRGTNKRRRSVSVALSVGLPPLAVSQHPALRSPDFPPAVLPRPATVRSSLARPSV